MDLPFFGHRPGRARRLILACLLAALLGGALCLPPLSARAEAAETDSATVTPPPAASLSRPDLEPLRTVGTATVASCLDGDTLTLTTRRTVRLAGIDTPEMKGRTGKPQYYARESRNLLREAARGQTVRLFQAGEKTQDRYGRIVADVQLHDGRSLSAFMLEQGAAYFYPHTDLTPAYQDWLRSLQARAIHERRGMWAWLLAQPFALQSYTGNKRSLRFFPADSREAQSIKPRNRVHFGTLMDAFLAGYAPARNASPWPEADAQ